MSSRPKVSSPTIKKLADLKPDSRNANKGTPRGNAMIQESLQQYGAGRSILLDKHGNILAGNKTAENFGAIGLEDVIVVQTTGEQLVAVQRMDLDASEPRAKQLAIADNRASEVSLDWDVDVLKEMAQEIDLAPFWTKSELDAMWPVDLKTDEDEAPPLPVTPVTKRGDLYIMGEHRLLCGDSTDAGDVARLMDGQKASLFCTDPPYGVAYGDETGNKASKFGKIANDENNGPRLQAFLESAFTTWVPHLNLNAAWYLWHAQMTQGFFAAAAAAAAGLLIHRQIVWVKPSLCLGHGDYHWRHELCFYGWREGNRAKWLGDRSQTTIWEIAREHSGTHPTQKPVEIFERPINFHTLPGDVCAEPFGGSGSQLIACEKTRRKCFMMELSEAYCDVIVQRWENATGKKAVLDGPA